MDARPAVQAIQAEVPLARCSATPPTCAADAREGPPTRMQFTTTPKRRRNVAEAVDQESIRDSRP